MNNRVLSVLGTEFLRRENPMTEVRTRYASDRAGDIDQKAMYILGRAKNATVSAALSPGMFVIMAGLKAPALDETGESVLFDKCPAGAAPDGYLEIKNGDFLGIRTLFGDAEVAGAVNGLDYVVGTDGRPAKSGDSTYPTSASNPFVVGVGWVTNRIMFGLPSRSAATLANVAAKIPADSANVNAAARTDFSQVLNIDPSGLKAGDELVIKGAIKLAAPAATTFQLYLSMGTVDIFSTKALDPVDAGDQLGFEVRVLVREGGTTGKILTTGQANLCADTGDSSSGCGLFDETAIDLSAPLTVKAAGQFSVAGANTAVLRDFQIAPTYRPAV